jgi:hypothetical protein
MTTGLAEQSQANTIEGRRPILVWATLLLAMATLVIALPGMASRVALFSSAYNAADNSPRTGVLHIENCTSGFANLVWTCRGTFEMGDPMADEPNPAIEANVRLAGSAYHYKAGATPAAMMSVYGAGVAYPWGGRFRLLAVIYFAGLVLLLVGLLTLLVGRRHRPALVAAFCLVTAALVFVALGSPLLNYLPRQ